MDSYLLLFFFPILIVIELIYFKIAENNNIIDKPNHRSSHDEITIRGGGIIFTIALLISPLYLGWQYSYFLLGLFFISLISFFDDIKPVKGKVSVSHPGVFQIRISCVGYQRIRLIFIRSQLFCPRNIEAGRIV